MSLSLVQSRALVGLQAATVTVRCFPTKSRNATYPRNRPKIVANQKQGPARIRTVALAHFCDRRTQRSF